MQAHSYVFGKRPHPGFSSDEDVLALHDERNLAYDGAASPRLPPPPHASYYPHTPAMPSVGLLFTDAGEEKLKKDMTYLGEAMLEEYVKIIEQVNETVVNYAADPPWFSHTLDNIRRDWRWAKKLYARCVVLLETT